MTSSRVLILVMRSQTSERSDGVFRYLMVAVCRCLLENLENVCPMLGLIKKREAEEKRYTCP